MPRASREWRGVGDAVRVAPRFRAVPLAIRRARPAAAALPAAAVADASLSGAGQVSQRRQPCVMAAECQRQTRGRRKVDADGGAAAWRIEVHRVSRRSAHDTNTGRARPPRCADGACGAAVGKSVSDTPHGCAAAAQVCKTSAHTRQHRRAVAPVHRTGTPEDALTRVTQTRRADVRAGPSLTAHAPRDELHVLRAEVQDQERLMRGGWFHKVLLKSEL